MPKVRRSVILRHPETRERVRLRPGDEVPGWASVRPEALEGYEDQRGTGTTRRFAGGRRPAQEPANEAPDYHAMTVPELDRLAPEGGWPDGVRLKDEKIAYLESRG